MKIATKLITGYICIAILIGIIGYISVMTTQKALVDSIGQRSFFLAQKTLENIEENIYNKIEIFQEY